MTIQVEFYGIPRARAGVSQVAVCSDLESAPFDRVIEEIAKRYPAFGEYCTCAGANGRCLQTGYIANIDGVRFIQGESQTIISSGQSIVILSADAGG